VTGPWRLLRRIDLPPLTFCVSGAGFKDGGRAGAASPGSIPISLNLDGCICTYRSKNCFFQLLPPEFGRSSHAFSMAFVVAMRR
jgi:hypothetical protein